jgi:hypothetical protein
VAYLMAARKPTGRGQGKIYTSKTCPQWPTSSTKPYLPHFYHLSTVFKRGLHWSIKLLTSKPSWSNSPWKPLLMHLEYVSLIS